MIPRLATVICVICAVIGFTISIFLGKGAIAWQLSQY